MENLISIPGRLHSVATEEHVAGANEIYDDGLEKLQDEINSYLVTNSITNVQYTNNLLRFYNSKGLIVKVIPLTLNLQQSDYAESDSSKVTFIKNKPTIPTKTSDLTNDSGFITDISGKQDVIEDLDDIRSGALAGATAYQKPQTGIPSTDLASAVQTSLGKADTALQTETDPTVPAWAKAQNKPTYTAQEVGALPDSTTIPSALSDLTDDATHRTVTDTEKTAWNNKVNRNSPSVIEPLKIIENSEDYWTTITSDDVVVNQKFDGTSTPISLKSLATTVGNKVDKVSGKGLSTEDYTTVEKTKLGGLPSTLATVATSGSYNDLNNRPCKSADETIYADDLESGTINIDAAGFAIQNIDILPFYVPITYDGHTYNKYLAVTESEHRQIIIKSACTISFLVEPITGEYNYSSYYISFNGTEIYHKSWYPGETKPFVTTLELASAGTLEIYCHDGDFKILKIDCASIDYTFSDVAFSGSYNDLLDKPTLPDAQIQSDWNQLDNTKKDFIKNKPTIPDVTTKADKVSNATNGNFAALDSNGNLIDSGHKHSDYLTQHQDLTNYVQKSQTAGLLKNDGTVDTTQYLSQHQDISGKEDITPIEAVASGTTAITAQVNKYYEVAGTVSSLTVTLPTPTANTEVTMVVVHLTVGASPTVIVTSVNEVVKFSAAYSVVANKEYELSCLYNGSKWIVSSMEVAV